MNIDEFHAACVAQPFRPFTIHMADGRSFHVPHPEFISHPPGADTTAVHPVKGRGFRILDVELVTEIDFSPPARASRRNARKK